MRWILYDIGPNGCLGEDVAKAQHRSSDIPEPEAESETNISRDTMYKMLANERRRYTIHYLKEQDDEVPLGLLAEQVGAWEHDLDTNQLTSDQRKTVYTALQQRHLPKLDEAGIVEFDKRAGAVQPTDALSSIDIYAEVVEDGEFPWSQYYLGLSTVTLMLLFAVWADAYPLAALPDIAWAVFCTVSFTISAIVHVVMTREMKLGTTQEPPGMRGEE